MKNETPLRIFLASPGDLSDERLKVKDIVERYNNKFRLDDQYPFELVGWESKRGTAYRPQDEINLLIGNAEFMVVLFKQSWGSNPGGPFGYTSGTEEELFTGLLDLGSRERPLEDIWVGFIETPDPAPEITELKEQIHSRHSLLYDSIHGDLDTKLTARLEDWQHSAGRKTPRWINLKPQTGKDILGAAKKRNEGEMLIRLGHADAGMKLLKESAETGGPKEQLSYARALGRKGKFNDALVFVRLAIETILNSSIELNSELAGDAFTSEAEILRKQGSDLEAVNRLSAILGEIDDRAPEMIELKARIYDQRGLANQRLDRITQARSDFERSYELRRNHSRPVEVVKSLLNLQRLEVRVEAFDAASQYAELVLKTLHGATPSDVHANAWTAIAQLRLRQNRAKEGVGFARQALALNEQTSHTSGIAVSLMVLGQCLRETGDLETAKSCFSRCIEVNESMDNEVGANRARWQLSNLNRAR